MQNVEKVTACGTSRLHYVPARQREAAQDAYASAIIRAAERLGIIARRQGNA